MSIVPQHHQQQQHHHSHHDADKDLTERTVDICCHDCHRTTCCISNHGVFLGQDATKQECCDCSIITTPTSITKEQIIMATNYAIKKYQQFKESNEFQSLTNIVDLPQYEHCQFELGKVLGQGGFSTVYDIKQSLLQQQEQQHNKNNEYVIKILRPNVLENTTKFATSVLGLVREGTILSVLNHPNIITVQGCSIGGIKSFKENNGRYDSYFLLLDKLNEMLPERIMKWKKDYTKYTNCIINPFKVTKSYKQKRQMKLYTLFLKRLDVCIQLANAISYLHSNNILHRDIKPSNIGFDSNGTIKLFDFDVSTILPSTTTNKNKNKDETFLLTKRIGTRRYMSPENGLGLQYNLKSDVYSFGIVLYEILYLKDAYMDLSKNEHIQLVYKKQCRPILPPTTNNNNNSDSALPIGWTKQLISIITKSWCHNPNERYTMNEIFQLLQNEYNKQQQLIIVG